MEKSQATGRNELGRFTKGNKAAQKHGVYALSRPSVRGIRLLKRYLADLKSKLEHEIGEPLTPQQEILLVNIIRAEEKLALIDMWFRKAGLFERDKLLKGRLSLQPASNFYISLMDSQRRALGVLGIDKRAEERILSPIEYIKKCDEEKAKEEAKDTRGKEITQTLHQAEKGPQRGSHGYILQRKT